jgi:hypothetical protein
VVGGRTEESRSRAHRAGQRARPPPAHGRADAALSATLA